ncbi:MAG: diaminopimelate epimerase [Terriglobales bacterium]
MMTIPFVKASACGNDFLLVNESNVQTLGGRADLADLTRRMCDRHNGVGADGVEWMSPDTRGADLRIRLINADGSPAEISGNGTRCVAAWYVSEHGGERVRILTDAGLKTCTLAARDGSLYEFETAMGEPQVGDPFLIKLAFGEVTGIPVSMGNPHYVVFKDQFDIGWQAEAAEIGRHHDFKFGVNVEFVHVDDAHTISARFFERGAGETQSSGTGSSAAAVAAIAAGRVQSPVTVRAPGGAQIVRWDGGELFLRGPAHLICRGEFLL